MTNPTNTAVLFGDAKAVVALAAPEVEVSLDGRPDPRVRLDVLEHEMGAAPRATFSVALGQGPKEPAPTRLEDASPAIRPGQFVRARLLRGGILPGVDRQDLVLFEGRVTRVEAELAPDGEALRFEAEDLAAQVLRRRVGGQRIRTADGAATHTPGLDLVLNPDGRPNASATPYQPLGRDAYTIFSPISPPGAVAWTLDEAVAYLLAEYADRSIMDVPRPREVRRVLDALVVRDVSLEGLTLGEALEALLELAGGRVVLAAQPGRFGISRRLDLWLPQRSATTSLAYQPVGQTFDAARTHFAALAIQMEFESAPRRYVARGDAKVYESTFDLVAGWDDSLASHDPDEFSPGGNPDFNAVRDVFRKWVLNEAGDYSLGPFNRGPAPDLSALFEGEPYVRRHRRFLGCLSRDGLGRSRGVYLELSLDGGASWQRLSMAAMVLPGECGIYLTDDPLPFEYLRACMVGTARVRVTAAVESDARLSAEWSAPGAEDLPGRTRYLNVPAGYRYRRVAPTSRFFGGPADEADDSARLRDLVEAAAEADERCPAPARIRVPFLAFGYYVGLRLGRVRGRPLSLARCHVGYVASPVIRHVRHRLAPEPETELRLD